MSALPRVHGVGGMRIAVLCAAGVLVAAVAGCGSEKQLPEPVVVPPEESSTGPAMPTASDPDARKLIDEAINAATANDPPRLAKTRTFRLTTTGTMRLPDQNNLQVEATRKLESVWPDKARVDVDFQSRTLVPIAIGFRRPSVWMFRQADRTRWEEVPTGQEEAGIASIGYAGIECMPLLTPLTDLNDPKRVVVTDARRATPPNQPFDTVKVHIPNCPPYTLSLDPATHHLKRIDFTITNSGSQRTETMVLDGHRPFDGILAPEKLTHLVNSVPAEEWKIDALEFPATIDESRFDPPKNEAKK